MESKITNLDYLFEMAGGDGKLIIEMISIFNTEVPVYMESMIKLLEMENWSDLARLAHKAKASASIMGMKEVVGELKYLEDLINEQKEKEKYSSCVLSIERKFNSAIEELKIISKTL